MKIVIIDDEADICFILAFELKARQHQAVTFTSALDAQKYFETDSADAIICDFQMPSMNGYEFFLWLKSKDINTPFYMLTGEPSMDSEQIQACGIKHIFFKPHDLPKISKLFNPK